ncbi:MAG TPA: hypothetical protein VHO48_02450, partial [Anaerolineaceae bacterium]|nr:hypothetical protein [Anaerolineaceae bacterium]
MKIITNDKLIQRNKKIGQAATVSSLAILGAGLYISFAQPQQIALAYVALLVGFVLSQIGIYFGNNWGRSPRPDEVIDTALKGLDDRYSVYHYTSPVPHLLVGPVGIWAILPYRQKGTFTFEKNRYRQKGGSFYLKVFAQEGLGRPELEAENQKKALEKALSKDLPEGTPLPPVNALLLFS